MSEKGYPLFSENRRGVSAHGSVSGSQSFATAVLLLLFCGEASAESLTETFAVVTDRTSRNISRFEPATAALSDRFVPDVGGFPESATFGPDQNVYVSIAASGAILRFNGSNGRPLGNFVSPRSGGLEIPEGLTFGPDGNLYVADFSGNAVRRYDGLTGAPMGSFVPPGAGGLDSPVGLTFGPDANLYVTAGTPATLNQPRQSRVLKFDGTTGAFISEFVSPGSGGLDAPFGLTFGPDGRLYVSSVLTHSVIQYDGVTGAFLRAFVPSRSGGLERPTGLTFGPDGHLYVASSVGSSIGILRYDGTTGGFLGRYINGESSGLQGPTGILFYTFERELRPRGGEPDVVTDEAGNRIIVWSEDGRIRAQSFDSAGNSITGPFEVSQPVSGQTAIAPRVAVLGPDTYGVVWEQVPGSEKQALASGSSVVGTKISKITRPSPVVPITPPGSASGSPTIAPAPGGGAYIAWQEGTSTSSIKIRKFGSTLTPASASVVVSGGAAGPDSSPSIAADDTGNVLVGWQRNLVAGASTVLTRWLQEDLSSGGEEVAVGSSGSTSEISVSGNARGNFAITYVDGATAARKRASGATSSVVLRKITKLGPAPPQTSPPVEVDQDPARSVGAPSVAVGLDGRMAVTWQAASDTGTGVFGRAFAADGTPEKTQFVVVDSKVGTDAFRRPSAALDRSGEVTVAAERAVGSAASGIVSRTQRREGTGAGGGGESCVKDAQTACLLNGRFRAIVRYRGAFDSAPVDQNALVRNLTGFASPAFETTFFYFNDPNNVEILLKMLDQGNVDASGLPTIAVLFGTATPLRVEVSIVDTLTGEGKTYSSQFGQMQGATDFTAFVK